MVQITKFPQNRILKIAPKQIGTENQKSMERDSEWIHISMIPMILMILIHAVTHSLKHWNTQNLRASEYLKNVQNVSNFLLRIR